MNAPDFSETPVIANNQSTFLPELPESLRQLVFTEELPESLRQLVFTESRLTLPSEIREFSQLYDDDDEQPTSSSKAN
jgi:hypothetical protein